MKCILGFHFTSLFCLVCSSVLVFRSSLGPTAWLKTFPRFYSTFTWFHDAAALLVAYLWCQSSVYHILKGLCWNDIWWMWRPLWNSKPIVKKPVYYDLTFVTWCNILWVVGIRRLSSLWPRSNRQGQHKTNKETVRPWCLNDFLWELVNPKCAKQ